MAVSISYRRMDFKKNAYLIVYYRSTLSLVHKTLYNRHIDINEYFRATIHESLVNGFMRYSFRKLDIV